MASPQKSLLETRVSPVSLYISGNLYLDSKVAGLKGIPVNSVDASVLKRSLKFLDPSDVSEFFDFVFTVVSE